ncbi:hypothetical protein QRX60_28600 [Amycolatopsis mongoliensis]|uniref:Uncharacterized protein n=1 Tax=Amycolatopsis mongoliensis TaxID=715475 RepID=A0A9Y2NDV4_9PSEU|nr:hypothetical protein [Amycolatopsis sp. 4-36]WIX98033.1 hypothetical protein QRX60_28600 [Amycolatopsis sp. 4-36]
MTAQEPRDRIRDLMLALAAVLVTTGVLSGGFLIAVVARTVMMALMTRDMNNDTTTCGHA